MAAIEGLAGEPEYISGGPRGEFSFPHRSVVRVVALGLLAIALGILGGYRLGFAHSPKVTVVRDVGVVLPIQGFPSGDGFGAGSVWVTVHASDESHAAPGYVARYDPVTRHMVAKVPVGAGPLAAQPGFASIWVSNAFDGTVTRIDPTTNTVSATIHVGPLPYQMAAAGGGLWVATQAAAVKINPVTNRVVARTPYPRPAHTEMATTPGYALGANAHGVWVSTAYGTVLKLRPSDGRLLATIPVQRGHSSQPGQVQIDGNNVWVSNYPIKSTQGPGAASEKYGPVNHLTDISATTNRIINRVQTGGYPVETFLPHHGTLYIIGNDLQDQTSELIRTNWPYQVVAYARPLGEGSSSFDVVDTYGHLWIPSFTRRVLEILPDSENPPISPRHGD